MSRFILGDCVRVMATFPGNAVDFILTDPPYLVGFRDRSGRTIAGDKTDVWLQPACNEMYRVLKKDALMVSFYGWNRVDRFMAAWKNAGFSVVGHLVFTKTYTSKAAYVGYRHECATSWQKDVRRCLRSHCPTCWAGNIQAIVITRLKSPLPACNRSLRASHTRTRLCWTRLQAAAQPVWPPSSPDAGISVSSCLNSITVPDSNDWPPCNGPCSRGPRMITGLNRRLRK